MDGGIQAVQGQDSTEKSGWRLEGGRMGGRVEKESETHRERI